VSILPEDLWSALMLGMALGATRPGHRAPWLLPFVAGGASSGLACALLTGRPEDAALCGLALAVLAWDRWNRKGRRAAKALGEKSRALLDAVVERLREAELPVPEGAGA
jgi:hypothetical protein